MKVLIITYYWPPSGGSGVQRWMYFAKYLSDFGIDPIVLTVDENQASYKFTDKSFLERVKNIPVFKTKTLEPLKIYSKIISGSNKEAIPQGFVGEKSPGFFQKLSRFIRGNLFIPDARVGWNWFAFKKAKEIIATHNIKLIITTGPPHSTHLIGLRLKKKFDIKWISDFRDPWNEVYYNNLLYKTRWVTNKDVKLEQAVLDYSDVVLTIGPSMQALLSKKVNKKNKVTYIYNGYDPELFKNATVERNTSSFTICHIGIMSDSQPITPFLKALSKLFKAQPELSKYLKFVAVGKVSPLNIKEIKEIVPELNFELIEYVPHKEAIQHMVNANLLLNSLAETENSKLLISGKLMEYIASGNPILCLGNPQGDAAALLNSFNDSVILHRDAVDEIYSFIYKVIIKWKNNSKFDPVSSEITKYSRYETTRELAKLIRSI